MKKIISSTIILLWFFQMNGQIVELDKTFDIPGKADIGDNPHIGYNSATGIFDYSFIIKAKSDKIKIENYQFDKDFNPVNSVKEELDIETAKQKYPWWNYQGDKFNEEMIIVDEDDELIIRSQNVEFTYKWNRLQYTFKADQKDKLKLRNADGAKYFHYRNWSSEDDPDHVYVLCGIKSKSDKLEYCKNFHILKIGKNLEIENDLEIKFDYPQDIVFPRFIDKKSERRGNNFDAGFILVFAPKSVGSNDSDPKKTNYTYVSINEKLTIEDRLTFDSPSSFWSIEDYLQNEKTGEVYLFGASLKAKDKYYDDLKDSKKFDGIEIMKVANHNVAWVKEYSIDEMERKVVMAPSQKKGDPYDGKRVFISFYMLTETGNLIVVGQQYFYDAMAAVSDGRKEVKYADCFGLAFNDNGELTGQYLYDMKGFMGGQKFPVFQFLFQGENPNNAYWMLIQPQYWDWSIFGGGGFYNTSRPVKPGNLSMGDVGRGFMKTNCDLVSSYIGKIDMSSKTVSDFNNYQVNKEKRKAYYLSANPPFMVTDDHKLILFGTQTVSAGKRLWFMRLGLE